MNATVEKTEKNVVTLKLQIEAQKAVDAYNKACKRISERINIAGFRKGKAPRPIVEKHVGSEYIKREALDFLLPELIGQAVKENSLDVISQPELKNIDFKIGQDVSISVKLELRPEIELGEYKNRTFEVEEYKQNENFLEKELEYVKSRFTTTEPVIGRKTIETDIVVFDFDGEVNGEKIKGGSAKNYSLDLGNSNFIPGFAEQLVGHEISEEFTIDVTFPENYHEESLKGQPAQFKIKINEIKEKKVPELNDELAKKVGDYETVDDLKKDIEKYGENLKKAENEKRALEQIFTTLLDEAKTDLSDTMIDRETDSMFNEMRERMTTQGADFEAMIKEEGKDKIIAELKEEAIKRIKNSLLLNKISVLEKIEVASSDISAKIDMIAHQYNADKQTIMSELFSNSKMISSLGQQVISEKVAKFLLDNNTINYVQSK